MDNYVERVINEFPMKISNSDTDLKPARENIFWKVTEKGYTSVSRIIFVANRARPGIH